MFKIVFKIVNNHEPTVFLVGLPMSSTQMPNYVMGSLYNQFVDKNIKTFDEFHVAVLEIFK